MALEKCAVCRNTIKNKESLRCIICALRYDIDSLKISKQRFHSYFSADQLRTSEWKCPECVSRSPKTVNANAPTQHRRDDKTAMEGQCSSSPDINNVTVRQKPPEHRGKQPPLSVKSPQKILVPGMLDVSDGGAYVTEDRLRAILKQEFSEALHTAIKNQVSAQLKNITEQVSDLRESLEFFNRKYEDMEAAMKEKNKVINELQKDNSILKYSLTCRFDLTRWNRT